MTCDGICNASTYSRILFIIALSLVLCFSRTDNWKSTKNESLNTVVNRNKTTSIKHLIILPEIKLETTSKPFELETTPFQLKHVDHFDPTRNCFVEHIKTLMNLPKKSKPPKPNTQLYLNLDNRYDQNLSLSCSDDSCTDGGWFNCDCEYTALMSTYYDSIRQTAKVPKMTTMLAGSATESGLRCGSAQGYVVGFDFRLFESRIFQASQVATAALTLVCKRPEQ